MVTFSVTKCLFNIYGRGLQNQHFPKVSFPSQKRHQERGVCAFWFLSNITSCIRIVFGLCVCVFSLIACEREKERGLRVRESKHFKACCYRKIINFRVTAPWSIELDDRTPYNHWKFSYNTTPGHVLFLTYQYHISADSQDLMSVSRQKSGNT